MRRYFLGIVAFGFVVVWATAGMTTAILALAACALIVWGPRLLGAKPVKKSRPARPRPVRTRPLHEELPLVPDDPSLIVELV